MCGFIVHKSFCNPKYIQRRGQDAHNTYRHKSGLIFDHFLLHITGEKTLQPFVDDGIICCYNGELYGLEFKQSDGENLIPLYKQWGIMFPKHLDGEYAIALYDFNRDIALFITDPFATKPLWRKGVECASYESGVGGRKIRANTIEGVEISTGRDLFSIHPYYFFDFDNQFKTSYDDCIRHLIAAIKKRAKDNCFIGLSSGYDSGAISCILKNLGANFKCYSIVAKEDLATLKKRISILGNVDLIESFDIKRQEAHLRDNAENFLYDIQYENGNGKTSYKDDYASKALSHICELAHNEGRKVCISGMGADEILSDYSLIPNQSEFKGRFPANLKQWKNFYDSCMYSYLAKEELVGGSWNIETRYPFLDKNFVQAFLWLRADLKNRWYKAPLHKYLTDQRFPFQPNKKIGFNV